MNIAIIGYGKMGKAIEQIAISKGHQIVFKTNETEDLPQILSLHIDVAIEFTQPESAFRNLSFCIQNQIPVISGTTGWLSRLEEIIELVDQHNGTFLYASNFSVGVNLFFEMNSWLSSKINALNFKPSITEIHHTEKKDSPSGTAITLAEGILKHTAALDGWINNNSTDHNKLSIISERKPNIPGTHTVTYESTLESISIKHIAHDRSIFADGAVKVSEWIADKKGVLQMADYIKNIA